MNNSNQDNSTSNSDLQNPIVSRFAKLWNLGESPPDVGVFLAACDPSPEIVLPVLIFDQRRRWQTDTPLKVEDYLAMVPEIGADSDARLQLVVGEFEARQTGDTLPDIDEYTARFEDIADTLRSRLQEIASKTDGDKPTTTATQTFESSGDDEHRIGRYRVIRMLGEGAFGQVFLAFDDELQRQVAVKVPTPERFQKPEDADLYLAEARTVAGLGHPNIVPVYDVGKLEDGSVYVVSRFIEGTTLADLIKSNRPSHDDAAKLIATVAMGLHHAHEKRLIHRDVKPANILIEESSGTPFVADFGLAIREEDYLSDSKIAGTPAYMSPEQARGEGHRLDGRSDIFSLGIVFYELLSSKRPFRGSTKNEQMHQVISVEPRPLRELDETVPPELERICLRTLSKRASDRYATAAEMADELLHWNKAEQQDHRELTIVPKGLRSFDTDDADFFLDLLPGPRDRDGLPESISFWKKRIEETDPDKTFNVGLIYGPSGCGKSSLVKAGLLPRLSNNVTAIYIESTPDDTESRILRALKKHFPHIAADAKLPGIFAMLRRSDVKNIVIVIDQFEQWLHAHREDAENDLVDALRHCDGGRLQVVVMIRDDFWMAAERFSKNLDIDFQPAVNAVGVDLFSEEHAANVLTKFGQAYGRFQGTPNQDQLSFMEKAVSDLAEEGRVVSVRLSLFADMVREKKWTIESLNELGGAAAVGITFLEETFSARTAPPKHRLHETAAREVLKSLLPEIGTDIKGHMRSHVELLKASGYEDRPTEFNDLLRILDGELRLITPTDPEGAQTESGSEPGSKYYQLTHDYLVPSLREWLTRKQQETWRGRATLRLEQRAAQWSRSKENRFLPSPAEYLTIQFGVLTKNCTQSQKSVLRAATRRYGFISAALLLIALTVGFGIREFNGRRQAVFLVDAIQTASESDLESLIRNTLPPLRRWAASSLAAVAQNENEAPQRRLRASLAMVASDSSQVEYLKERLLDCSIPEFGVTRSLLEPYQTDLKTELWTVLHDTTNPDPMRFRAGMALAMYAKGSEQWSKADHQFLATEMVNENPVYWERLLEYLEPKRESLIDPLSTIFRDPNATDSIQKATATALSDYVSDSELLVRLTSEATVAQHAILYPKLVGQAAEDEQVQPLLESITQQQPQATDNEPTRIKLGKQRAGAAINLVRLEKYDAALEALRVRDDPESLTQFVHGCKVRGITVEQLLVLLNRAGSVSERYGLLLALGEFEVRDISEDIRATWLDYVKGLYANDPSSGIHGASGWLLRQWGLTEEAKAIDEREIPYSRDREWFTLKINLAGPLGFENYSYFTFVVFRAGEYRIGSLEYESDRESDETVHTVELSRDFAVLEREVTRGEYESFRRHLNVSQYSPSSDSAMVAPHWYDSVRFCRWLTSQTGLAEADQCYPNPESLDKSKYPADPDPAAEGMPRNWIIDLSKRGFRLLTESEWEVACRSGVVSRYGFGCDESHLVHYGWYQVNSGSQAHVGRVLRPNLRGLFDMHGNAYEWVHDWFGSYPSDLELDPLGEVSGQSRVFRGGGWDDAAASCRAAFRDWYQPTIRSTDFGFRLALVPFGAESSEASQ